MISTVLMIDCRSIFPEFSVDGTLGRVTWLKLSRLRSSSSVHEGVEEPARAESAYGLLSLLRALLCIVEQSFCEDKIGELDGRL